ncbi:MAG: DUF5658 family protein [Dehalococcoidia bacterium]|jgi:hypothetical protein
MIEDGKKMRAASVDRAGQGHMLFALLLLAQFQLWDGIMTQVFVRSGFAVEANRIMEPLINSGSFLAVKLLGTAALLPLLWFVYKRYPRVAFTAASFLSIIYMGIVTWNFVVFFS